MKKIISLALMAMVTLVLGACGKNEKAGPSEREAVVLVNTALYPIADANKAKANGWPKRLEKVWVTSDKVTNEMYPVTLADKTTKGFILAKHLYLGEKKIATFSVKTDWHLQPDAQSHKMQTPIAKGTKALIVSEQDGWVKVNLGLEYEGWVKAGSFELGDVEVKKDEAKGYEVTIRGIKVILRASSMLPDAEGYSFTPNMAMDGKMATAWQEGKDGDGHGEWIELEFPDSKARGISLVNGFVHTDAKLGDLYALNSRVKRVKVVLDGNEMGEVDLLDEVKDLQSVLKSGGKAFKTVRLVIADTFSGSKWSDTSISEIAFE